MAVEGVQKQQKTTSDSSSKEEDGPPVLLLEEIIVEILCRLPVESLLRCRSVCKLWYSLISDPLFVKSHLSLSTSNTTNPRCYRLIFSTLPKINLKTSSLYDALYHHSLDPIELDYPMKHPRKSVWIVGSSNGLLCIAIEEDTLFLWNPTTRKSTRLPYCGRKSHPGCYVLYGFGYSSTVDDDYRVVEISCVFKDRAKYSTTVRIYSLKFGNWKKIDAFPHGIPLDDSGKFSNGALHWAASQDFGSSYSWIIVSLDLAKETYGEILQPVYDEGDKDLTLGVLGESLCVLCNYRGIRADVWVMKVYGVKDSWTKLVSIPYLTDPGRDQFSVPFCVSNDGKLLLQLGSKLIVYDSKSSSSSEIQNVDECLEACIFVESLVSPDAPNRPWR
ncbi:hypothetical protein M8C21_031939 [Ambrosia artemisiifolia]|uniref:F-box domain-containing protein n=1 Tax=Ambrosia artemisiifolia TaxID=4212 RepID=A0AAD5C6W9_AMBAR|nr:hypothetical protein M8C21_031939 [Ambrosia artemisiifolia]